MKDVEKSKVKKTVSDVSTVKKSVSEIVTLTGLVEQIAQDTKMSKSMVETISVKLIQKVRDALLNGKSVRLGPILGTFSMRVRNATTGRNPRTGDTITIPERRVPYLRPSKDFKESCKPEEGASS